MTDVKISNHARKRMTAFFPNRSLKNDYENAVSCNSDEIYKLRSTPSYKRLKATDKKNRVYLKTNDNEMYIIGNKKTLRSGKRVIDIVTIIDLTKENISFSSDSFKKEAIKKEYELKEESKKLPKQGKKRHNYEQVGDVSKLFFGQKKLLDRLICINDKNIFEHKFKLADFNIVQHSYSLYMLDRLNKVANRLQDINSLTKQIEDKNIEPKKTQDLKDLLRSNCLSITTPLLTKRECKFELDFLLTKKAKRSAAKLLADTLFAIDYALFDVLDTQLDLTQNKKYDKVMKIIRVFADFKGVHGNLDDAISKLVERTIQRDRCYVLNLAKAENLQQDIYSVEIRRLLHDLDFRIQHIKTNKNREDLYSFKRFFVLLIDGIENKGLIKAPMTLIEKETLLS